MVRSDDPRAHLPLRAHVFQILLTLLERERHGYSIIQDIEKRTDGEMVLGTSSLYAAIRRMVQAGLLVECDEPEGEQSTDQRRRYYRVTDLGREVAREEGLRIRRLGEMVAGTGLLDSTPRRGVVEEGS
jgi:DNA-binding PadR family transcriptional regulator